MDIFKTALAAIIPLFCLVLIGYVGKKLRVLPASDADVLSRFVVDIALPAFIIDAFVGGHVQAAFFKLPPILWIETLISIAIVYLGCRIAKAGRKTTGALMMVTAFGNTGYMGYPITTALFPGLLPAAVICDQVGMAVLLYPGAVIFGTLFGRTDGEPISKALGRFARSPLFISLLIGLLVAIAPRLHRPADPAMLGAFHATVAVGAALQTVLHTIALATIPVILISIGLRLTPSTLPGHWKGITAAALIKLAVAPIVGWAIARFALGLHGQLLSVAVLESAVPSSAAATVFAAQYEMDSSLAVGVFFALTVASVVTIPIALAVLR